MNGLRVDLATLEAVASGAPAGPELVLCPPASLIALFAERAAGGPVAIGGQDCHAARAGAHTGDLSAEMLADAGAAWVILGHSERRADHGETSAAVRAKAEGAARAGLRAILCIGETEAERDAGETLAVLESQLAASLPDGATAAALAVAYEPVWAIGTGRTPTLAEIAEAHAHLRARLPDPEIRLIYGGSVKPANAREILALPEVDGALVGGASLKAADFLAIAAAAAAAG